MCEKHQGFIPKIGPFVNGLPSVEKGLLGEFDFKVQEIEVQNIKQQEI